MTTERNLCSQCSERVVEGESRCLKHKTSGNESSRRARAKRKALGLCVSCDTPVTKGIRCERHALLHNQDYRRRVEMGVCPGCKGTRDATGLYCSQCKEESKRKKSAIRLSGFCPNHTGILLIPGTTRCQKCVWMMNESDLKAKYALALEDFAQMELRQSRLCACCGEQAELVVDHDHKTGKVRGLLCAPCNRTIGHSKENPQRLRAAAKFLESWPEI